MNYEDKKPTNLYRQHFLLFTSVILILSMLAGCGPSTAELAVSYAPLPGEDWKVSTPAEQGLDPNLVAELYYNAAELDTLYGLLIVKNGHLIAEDYFNEGSVEQKAFLASATKSFTSALVGIAVDQGCLSSIDQKMIDFFPEFADKINDPRKEEITIRELLQMRSGYLWEERTPYMDSFFSSQGYWLPFIAEFPLTNIPGTEFGYSNLTSHILGVIVARECDTDLKSYAQEYLFSPIDAEVGDWSQDADSYYYGSHGMPLTARDRAKFGLLYINDGEYDGNQVISADWVEDSLQRHSDNIDISGWIPGITSKYGYYRDLGYGYQWWSAKAGDHQFNYANGHGGNQIVLLDKLDMVIVTSADRLYGDFGGDAWEKERAIIELVGKFINSLPSE
ncbi:MAG: serine hydrolase [Anaerolineae bacterium]|jgi:CubicO group peptidase (beta-lactamase class C family)|nr:serine hydrolase [Anaerolineae bacterium]MBT7072426.1 serine hydrolase [Anaerolineae bacterium]MBT7326577.1 serine hydrolase [Anaerolineae bacterium]